MIRAGDTLVVRLGEPSEYLASDGWTTTLHLGTVDGSSVSGAGVASGGLVTYTVAAAKTAQLAIGSCAWAVVATKAAERYTVSAGRLSVLADATGDQSQSELAHVERVIAACQAALEGRLDDAVLMYQLPDGIMVQKMGTRELRETLALYKAKRAKMLRGGRPRVREAWYAIR